MKKNSLLALAILFISISSIAQTIVSTTPSNKKGLLEEFTGIHCGYCPDGHKIAGEIMAANPGNVFMIALHQGSYANPGAGEPDYKTGFGDAIAGQTGLTGYPAGTVNRHIFSGSTTSLSRSAWSASTTTIIGQASPVNLAVQANVNYATRQLTILVEAYYTGNAAQPKNFLNVALLQNNVKGPQSGASANPTAITADGKYLHQHMLRHMLTGQWGDTIHTTTTGTFVSKTYTYTIPADYRGVPVELPQLEVVAFITETRQEVLTAADAHVNKPSLDASVSSINNLPAFSFTGIVSPTVVIKNECSVSLTNATVNYQIDNGSVSQFNWTGTLLPNQTTNIPLPQQTATGGGSKAFKVFITTLNSGIDSNSINDNFQKSFSVINQVLTSPVSQDFSSTTFPPTNMLVVDNGVDNITWTRQAANKIGSAGSAFINFFNSPTGQTDDLFFYPVNFTGLTTPTLQFWVAYRQYASENDKLQVDISLDSGATWTNKWMKSGSTLKTGAAITSNFTSPTATEWRQESIDLTQFINKTSVFIRIRATSAFGNNAFVDGLEVKNSTEIMENNNSNSLINIFPNPASDNTTLNIFSKNASNSQLAIYDITGKLVFSNNYKLTEGENYININTSKLIKGIYNVALETNNEISNIRLVISK